MEDILRLLLLQCLFHPYRKSSLTLHHQFIYLISPRSISSSPSPTATSSRSWTPSSTKPTRKGRTLYLLRSDGGNMGKELRQMVKMPCCRVWQMRMIDNLVWTLEASILRMWRVRGRGVLNRVSVASQCMNVFRACFGRAPFCFSCWQAKSCKQFANKHVAYQYPASHTLSTYSSQHALPFST
jgi:hypothetical protein